MSTLASDDFNRANGGLGANWTTFAGAAPQISTNTCIANGASKGIASYSAATWPNAQWSQAFVNSSGGNDGGPMIRSGGTDCYYSEQFGGTLELNRYNNNSTVIVASSGGSPLPSGGTLYIEAQGSSLVLKVNGSTIISTTDSTLTSGNAGVYCDNNTILDNWAGGDFGAPFARRLAQFPNKGTMPRNYGARVLGARQGFTTTVVPLTVVLGQVTETDTAQPITRIKLRALGQVTETDTAQPITRVKLRVLGQPSETDTAQALTRLKAKLLGLVTETDTAQPITRAGSTVAVGQVTETDTAQPITRIKLRAIGQVTETDTAQPITRVKLRAIGQVTEIDTAQPLGRAKTKLLGMAQEVDSAFSLISSLVSSTIDGAVRLLLRRR